MAKRDQEKKRCRERTKIATAPAKQRQLHRPRDVWTKIFLTELSLQTSIFKSHDSSFSAFFFFFFVYFFWLLSHSLFKQHAQLGNARCSQTRYHCDHCDHCNPSPVHRAGHWSEAIEWEDEKREKVMLPEMERHCGSSDGTQNLMKFRKFLKSIVHCPITFAAGKLISGKVSSRCLPLLPASLRYLTQNTQGRSIDLDRADLWGTTQRVFKDGPYWGGHFCFVHFSS